jgi:hypothetical protein
MTKSRTKAKHRQRISRFNADRCEEIAPLKGRSIKTVAPESECRNQLELGMSIEDLHDIAAQLHKFAEEGGTLRAPTLQETHVLFKTALRGVHELESLERRVSALEGKAPPKRTSGLK